MKIKVPAVVLLIPHRSRRTNNAESVKTMMRWSRDKSGIWLRRRRRNEFSTRLYTSSRYASKEQHFVGTWPQRYWLIDKLWRSMLCHRRQIPTLSLSLSFLSESLPCQKYFQTVSLQPCLPVLSTETCLTTHSKGKWKYEPMVLSWRAC